jgi:DNA polymerase III delta prime subunit
MNELWVDKYAPKSFEDYIWTSTGLEATARKWVEDGFTDNLLLIGPPGVGKTSLSSVLLNELGIPDSDRLFLNGVREGDIDTIRTKVYPFISSGGWNGLKYVIFDEADKLSHKALDSLKADMEEFSSSVRWILTSNTYKGISDAIRDRCVQIEISRPDVSSFEDRMMDILVSENIEVDEDNFEVFQGIIKKTYPSLRGCIRSLQSSSITGRLVDENNSSMMNDWKMEMVDLFQSNKIRAARDLICVNVMADDIVEVYRWLYNNIEIFDDIDRALLIIRQGLVNHSIVADPEINLSATLIELAMLNDVQ